MSTATQYECMSDKQLVETFDHLCGEHLTGDPKIDELLREMASRLTTYQNGPGIPPKGK